MADIFDGYALGQAWDEMFAAPGKPRRPTTRWSRCCQPMDPSELRLPRRPARAGLHRPRRHLRLRRRGAAVPARPGAAGHRRADEWDLVDRGVRQRVQALEAFLADVYGAGHGLPTTAWCPARSGPHRRAVPPRGRTASTPPNGVRVHVAGIDLIRDEHGSSGCSRTTCGCRRGQLRDREPAADDQDVPRPVRRAAGATTSTSTRPGCSPRCARPPRTASADPTSSCSPPACTTPPTSSTRCSPG